MAVVAAERLKRKQQQPPIFDLFLIFAETFRDFQEFSSIRTRQHVTIRVEDDRRARQVPQLRGSADDGHGDRKFFTFPTDRQIQSIQGNFTVKSARICDPDLRRLSWRGGVRQWAHGFVTFPSGRQFPSTNGNFDGKSDRILELEPELVWRGRRGGLTRGQPERQVSRFYRDRRRRRRSELFRLRAAEQFGKRTENFKDEA